MDEPFEITADEIRYDSQRNLYVADRRVHVVQGQRSLRARWVAFSTETRLGVAEGDVRLAEDGSRLSADFMIFNVDTLRGTLYQGELDALGNGFHVRAQEMIRTGDDTFTVRDGIFTTCRCEDGDAVPWALRAAEADVELGAYGTLTNSTFEVLGVPVLWIPWVFFPIKSERESGLLMPDFQFGGRGGIGAGFPFFWAAHPQLNVTLTRATTASAATSRTSSSNTSLERPRKASSSWPACATVRRTTRHARIAGPYSGITIRNCPRSGAGRRT